MIKVFIDGQEGTTGLQLKERLLHHSEVELLCISEESRKHIGSRRELINQSDVTFLCLPDDAARESVSLVNKDNTRTKILDASTAHRTVSGWEYGLPELSKKQRKAIIESKRVAVPGCYATGFITLVSPLVSDGIIAPYMPISCNAVSGYSGAGKKAIAAYNDDKKPVSLEAPRFYGLTLSHKHIPEMTKYCLLSYPPLFTPVVDNYYSGMVVCVPLHTRGLSKKVSAKDVHGILCEHYKGQQFIKVEDFSTESPGLDNGFLSANALSGTNSLQIYVFGNNDQILLVSRFDNLGKGASGAAVQCMNLMMGFKEAEALAL